MRIERSQQQTLVYRKGKLCWRIRSVNYEYTRPPWYKFWKDSNIEVTYGEPRYIEVLEDES